MELSRQQRKTRPRRAASGARAAYPTLLWWAPTMCSAWSSARATATWASWCWRVQRAW